MSAFDLLFVCVLKSGHCGRGDCNRAVADCLRRAVRTVYPAEISHPAPRAADFRVSPWMAGQMLSAGLSMGFMMSLVNFGSVLLQGAINTFGEATILAHTAARRLTELFMLPFSVFGTTMATFSSQNWGAKKPERIRSGILHSLVISWIWCAVVILAIYTMVPALVRLVTGTSTPEVIETASLYLRIDGLFYFVTAGICVLRNSLQGMGRYGDADFLQPA